MSRTRVYRVVAIATGLALALSLYSCALTSTDLSGGLVGRVFRAGVSTPLSGAVVECEGVLAVSAVDGTYSLSGIPPGDRVVLASLLGYDDYSQIVGIDGATLHDVYLNPYVGPAELSGHVNHTVLGPIEGASVIIGDLTVITDSLGFYEYPDLAQETYSMVVTKDGFRSLSQDVHLTDEINVLDIGLKKLAQATVWSVADASILMGSPGMNFGDEPDLYLHNNQIVHERFYIRFDVTGIEPTAESSSAKLRLYDIWDIGEEDLRVMLVARPLWAWDESAITWANAPQTTGASVAGSTFEDRWYEVDVTTYFNDWLGGHADNFGLLVDSQTDHSAPRFVFASREYAETDKWPHVVLEYAW